MAKEGERHSAARETLIDQAAPDSAPTWAATPETGDEAVRSATGRGWDEWCAVIDAWPGHTDGHTAIAAYLQDQHQLDGWWAQSVTVGYERIAGRRLPYQRPDGTFSAGKSRILSTDHAALRAMLLDDADRADLFPGIQTELRSRPTSKVLRLAVGGGIAQVSLEPLEDGRVKAVIDHEGLPSYDDVQRWKQYWSEWLAAIDGA